MMISGNSNGVAGMQLLREQITHECYGRCDKDVSVHVKYVKITESGG